jgi:hypothetical protein
MSRRTRTYRTPSKSRTIRLDMRWVTVQTLDKGTDDYVRVACDQLIRGRTCVLHICLSAVVPIYGTGSDPLGRKFET